MSAAPALRPAGDRYVVVVNHEDQYSVWFADRALPAGWTATGAQGTRQECLDHIEQVWTDLTPRSVRASHSQAADPAAAWLRGLGSRELTAQQRLFVFPHAGAGASAYRLSAYLPDTVEVCTVQLPGREARSAEPALTSLDEAVAALAPLIADHTDLPYAFFGHSMGSLIAFETARRLRALGMRLPDRLFLSGMRAPGLPDRDPRHTLPDDKLLATAEFDGVDAELQELLLPLLRADLTLCETYTHRAEAPLPCPLTVLAGSDDDSVDGTELAAWRTHTSVGFALHLFPGAPHLYVRGGERQLAEAITRTFPARG
ncbi:thioesterase domain-containing protein [Streptomyces decoyicus]|uniref:thioesterase domain-containing protein n=1 Tax=Streptomyces decoyicus TaxID=249567 RepID=UPI002DD82EEF|nr:thioesterase domain-containing protein [Streptomyces decoyicus]